MQCAPNLWTHRPVVPERTSEADDSRALPLSDRGDP